MQKPKFTVIPDTNILWVSEKTDCVAPAFQTFWDEFSKAADFALFVPEVVLGELKYQHFESARKALDSARQQLERLSSITGNQHRTHSTEERIRKQIDAKFQRWLKKIGASEIPIRHRQLIFKCWLNWLFGAKASLLQTLRHLTLKRAFVTL